MIITPSLEKFKSLDSLLLTLSRKIWLSGPKSGPDKWPNPLLWLNLFRKIKENGAPGMHPNWYKVVYYQWLIEVTFSKSGPENGPRAYEEAFWSRPRSFDTKEFLFDVFWVPFLQKYAIIVIFKTEIVKLSGTHGQNLRKSYCIVFMRFFNTKK